MTRLFVVWLVLVLVSSSIGHKVLKVPIKMEYIDNTQVVGSTSNLHSDLENVELRDVKEEFVINARPGVNKIPYVTMWYPQEDNIYEQRFMLDTNSSWMAATVKGCYGSCLYDVDNIPKQFHDWEEQNTTIKYGQIEAISKICKVSISPKQIPWFYATNVSLKSKYLNYQ